MLKIKIRLSFQNFCLLRDVLMEAAEAHGDDHMQKLLADLWLQAYLKFHAKTLFVFKKEKKCSLTISQAIALMKLLQKKLNPDDNYRFVLFQEVIASIDQQTA